VEAFVLTVFLIFMLCTPRVISHFLGCFCRAWDGDDLGVYQGAYSVAPPRIPRPLPLPLPLRPLPALIVRAHFWSHVLVGIVVRLYSPHQVMPPR
jgi:hypothetical protein